MDFQPDDLAVVAGEVAQFPQGAPDLGQRLFRRDLFGQRVGAHLYSSGPYVLGQENVFLGSLDVFAQLGLVGGVVIERAAEAHQLDLRVLEPPPDFLALLRRKTDLHLVGMPGA